MTSDEKIEIPLSKGKLTMMPIGSIVWVAIGVGCPYAHRQLRVDFFRYWSCDQQLIPSHCQHTLN